MYKSIVVGTDGSQTATVAVDHAIELAKTTGATLHVVTAHHKLSAGMAALGAEHGGPTFDTNEVNQSIALQSEKICEVALRSAKDGGVPAESHVRAGEAADVIVAVAEDVNADLVVIGNRGMSGVKRFVLGSVPNKVSHHCPCNLLIVQTC
jgi:nucleotide-binding universal stress UspA family protein